MSFYKEPDQEELKQGRTATGWAALALLFIVIAVPAQIVWFVMLLTNNKNTLAAFIVMVGSYVLAEYCRWCAKDSAPESWKK